MRRSPHTSLNALGALLTLAALALLWQLRPGLPALPQSWTAAMSTVEGEELLLFLLWIALAAVLLLIVRALLSEIAVAIKEHREQRLAAFAERMVPKPAPPAAPPPPSRYGAYADRYAMTLAPRPDPDAYTAPTPPVAVAQASGAPATQTRAQQESQPALSISVLGPLKIDGLAQPIKRAPTRELIAYLALHPTGARRDELIEAIWPGQDPKRTLGRFWQSVTDAHKAFGEGWVREGERYQLDRTRVDVDLDELDRLLAISDAEHEQQALQDALTLWRGAPLAGCDYLWAEGDIHRLHATLLDLLGRVGQSKLANGDPRGALQAAEQAITLDDLHEASWRLALEAEHALGLRGSLTKRYDALSHLLDEQLGLRPSQETRMMYRQLLGQS